MLRVESETISKKIIIEGSFEAIFHEDQGVVELEWDENLVEVDLQTIVQLREAMFTFGQGKKLLLYISTKPFMNMTEDAKRYCSTKESQQYTLASAILVDNLAKRILYNFFIKFYPMPIPNKAFKSKEESFDWLKSL